MREDFVVICNVGDHEWHMDRTYGHYFIPAAKPGEPAVLRIDDRNAVMDAGDNHKLPIPVRADKIAADLVADLGKYGVFVCEGPQPSEAEIKAANEAVLEEAKRLVFEGDQEWARTHNYRVLSDNHRRAVKRLGLERDWCYEPKEMQECPVCGETLKPNVAICKTCGAILNREKAQKFGLVGKRSKKVEDTTAVPA